jgi:hypothetical protein
MNKKSNKKASNVDKKQHKEACFILQYGKVKNSLGELK